MFQGLEGGDYLLGVTADGYEPIGGATAGDVSRPRVHINAGPSVQHLDISMIPPDPC